MEQIDEYVEEKTKQAKIEVLEEIRRRFIYDKHVYKHTEEKLKELEN